MLTFSPVLVEAGQQIASITTTVRSDTGVVSIADESGALTTALAAAQAVATDFTMPPSVTSTSLGQFVSQRQFRYICTDANTVPVNCAITLAPQAVPNSGGHDHHDDNRPKGAYTATSGNTGTSGFDTIYTAPEVSGVISMGVTLNFPAVPPATVGQTVSFTHTMAIEIPGLQSLPPGNYNFIGARPGKHTDNHYGTESMIAAVTLLADEYTARSPGQPLLDYNDLSLVQGGLYDAYENASTIWKFPHRSHRFGVDIDVRPVSRAQRLLLFRLLRGMGLRWIDEGTDTHYHFRRR